MDDVIATTSAEKHHDVVEQSNCDLDQLQYEETPVSSWMVAKRALDGIVVTQPTRINSVPVEILLRIFGNLELKERATASQVCQRWNSVLSLISCSLQDVVVFNVFEEEIWNKVATDNPKLGISTVSLNNIEDLKNIIKYVKKCSSVKLWYDGQKFAEECIDVLADSAIEMSCMDLYPYSPCLVMEHLHERFPQLQGITTRPHGSKFFWSGLDLPSFPRFDKMTTLVLDSFNPGVEVVLPPSLTTLEFQNRQKTRWLDILPKLSNLKRLEYFSMSHADMSKREDLIAFLDAIDITNLPKLNYLILRFCKFTPIGATTEEDIQPSLRPFLILGNLAEMDKQAWSAAKTRQMALKMIKFDLCYGKIDHMTKLMLEFNKCLAILTLNVMCEKESLQEVFNLTNLLDARNIWLHLSIMERDDDWKDRLNGWKNHQEVHEAIPSSLFRIMTKFEATFMRSSKVITALLGGASVCQELKFIQCKALTNEHLEAIAKNSKMLRKLSVVNCVNTCQDGMINFVRYFEERKSKALEITWKRNQRYARPASFYLELVHENKHLLEGRKARFLSKTFSDSKDGESVHIWDKKKKSLTIQDYSASDAFRVIGVTIRKDVPELVKDVMEMLIKKVESHQAEEKNKVA